MFWLILFVGVLVAVFVLGPREQVELFWNTATSRIPHKAPDEPVSGADLKALRSLLTAQEETIAGIVEGTEKNIRFSSESRPRRTHYSVLYLHGFSATRPEISPLPERVAQSLHANYYATRLTGHGLDGQALAESTANDWQFDTMEAWQVAHQLGEKVIVISTSTGATLTAWLAQQPEVKPFLDALILVSPNFQPHHWATPLFLWPWARYWMRFLAGETYGWEPTSEMGEKYWTYRYPTEAIFGMAALVKAVRKSHLERIETPTLFIYSDFDKVVKARVTDDAMRRWGSEIKHRIAVPAVEGDNNHVVTGDIVRPSTTDQITTDVLAFLKNLPSHQR